MVDVKLVLCVPFSLGGLTASFLTAAAQDGQAGQSLRSKIGIAGLAS